ncbi:uncharacterized protein BDR25DRAFT_312948 [Lindgomyces ingoldianus]|uniref:Uncharacterized protein n=1 Tax=Lindgomyces ingoldianus TaxID=673940 RepID=A0ACB6R0Q5_9PLEO|nr:uncharacterized protein BDR25DRAFT_312948 [Lindgomyces ingoldianus]KAF2472403.1 hypothetical protein BDR25DRAFT_312948 [Lindgomyces ingoldianus]
MLDLISLVDRSDKPGPRKACDQDPRPPLNLHPQQSGLEFSSLSRIKKREVSSSLRSFRSIRACPNPALDIWGDTALEFTNPPHPQDRSGKNNATSVKIKGSSGRDFATKGFVRKDYVSMWKGKKGASETPPVSEPEKFGSNDNLELFQPSPLPGSSKEILVRVGSGTRIMENKFVQTPSSKIPLPPSKSIGDIQAQTSTFKKPAVVLSSRLPILPITTSLKGMREGSVKNKTMSTTPPGSSTHPLPSSRSPSFPSGLDSPLAVTIPCSPLLSITRPKEVQIQNPHNDGEAKASLRLSMALASMEQGPKYDGNLKVVSRSATTLSVTTPIEVYSQEPQDYGRISPAPKVPPRFWMMTPKEVFSQAPQDDSDPEVAPKTPLPTVSKPTASPGWTPDRTPNSKLSKLSMTLVKTIHSQETFIPIHPIPAPSTTPPLPEIIPPPQPAQSATGGLTVSGALNVILGLLASASVSFEVEHLGEVVADELVQKMWYNFLIGVILCILLFIWGDWANGLLRLPESIGFLVGRKVGSIARAASDGYRDGRDY